MTATAGSTRGDTIGIIRAVLAATCACPEGDVVSEGVVIIPAREVPGRLRFPLQSKPLLVVTMGAGVVVSCHSERLAWARATLGPRTRDEVFSAPTMGRLAHYVERDGQSLVGPVLKYTCDGSAFRPAAVPAGVEIRLVEGSGIDALYAYAGFDDALTYRPTSPRPTMVAAVVTRGTAVVGIAAASADTDMLWQVGVTVVEVERGRGIGRAVVSHLTEAILSRGKVPYYSMAVSNLRSRAVAVSLGFWPVWTELYAKDR